MYINLDVALVELPLGDGDRGPPLGLVASSDSLKRRGLPLRFGVVEPLSLLALSFFLLLPACGLLGGGIDTTEALAPMTTKQHTLYSVTKSLEQNFLQYSTANYQVPLLNWYSIVYIPASILELELAALAEA